MSDESKASQANGEASVEEQDRHRGVGEYIREAWSQALVAVNATEDEVQKILGRVTNLVEVGPDEARRLGSELSEKLRHERGELEDTLQAAVHRAIAPFRLPGRDELASLGERLDRLEERIERLASRRPA